MPVSPYYRHDHHDDDGLAIALAASDMSLADQSPFLNYGDDKHAFDSVVSDSEHMIFQFDDAFETKPFASPVHEPKQFMNWDSTHPSSQLSYFPGSPESTSSQLDFGATHMPPNHDRSFASGAFNSMDMPPPPIHDFNYSNWIADPDAPPSASAPIDIPFSPSQSSAASSFAARSDNSSIFPDVGPFSPTTAYAALQPLPRSYSPSMDATMAPQVGHDYTMSPSDASLSPPTWAAQLWQPSTPSHHPTSPLGLAMSPLPMSDDPMATQRPRTSSARKSFASVTDVFHSSSAPSPSYMRSPMSRAYSRRADSISDYDDRDGTVRRKKRSLVQDEEDHRPADKADLPLKSTLKPPKLAPSAWQLYFTDWIQRHQATSSKKLNVAQAAKEAGQEYARLSAEEKEPYRRRSQALKEARERDHAAYMRSLSPDDIKRENAFRTAQRKAGKSRKGNIKDPNAPKKPLSAYFMFLQRIRADPDLVREVFGDESETTKQSVLAAAKWRSMTDDERKPFLAQAEQEKLEYEAARKMYEEGTTGYSSSINFSILPGSPINSIAFPSSSFLRPLKQERSSPESDSADDGSDVNNAH